MNNLKNISNYDLFTTQEYQRKIKEYFFAKYPHKVNILNHYGWILPETLNKLLVFARKRKDTELKELIQNFINKLNDIQTEKNIKKYNL